MRHTFILLCALLLSACKVKRTQKTEHNWLSEELSQLWHWDERLEELSQNDSLLIIHERFDSIGRIKERTEVRQGAKAQGVAREQRQKNETKIQTTKSHLQTHETQSQSTQALPWWLLFVSGVIVGVFVSRTIFKRLI